MKRKVLKIGTAVVAVALSAVMVSNVVGNHTLEAKAAPTLVGIEKLISNVQSNAGEKYTILEVVPQIKDAEIGYLIGGYEPALSKYDAKTGRWFGWKEQLEMAGSDSARRELLNNLSTIYTDNANLRSFVAKETNENGTVTVDDITRYGVFEKYTGSELGKDRYSLTFKAVMESSITAGTNKTAMFTTLLNTTDENKNVSGNTNKEEGNFDSSNNQGNLQEEATSHTCYYKATAVEITSGNFGSIKDGETVYIKNGDTYETQGSFKLVKGDIQEALNPSSQQGKEEVNNKNEENNGINSQESDKKADVNTNPDQKTETNENLNQNAKDSNDAKLNTDQGKDTDSKKQNSDDLDAKDNKKVEQKDNQSNTGSNIKEQKNNEKSDIDTNQQAMGTSLGTAGWLTATNTVGNTESTITTEAVKYYYFDFTVTTGDAKGDDGKLYVVDTIELHPEGEYVFTEITADPLTGGQYYTFKGREIQSNINFKNSELFKANVLNMDPDQYDSFPVEVVTLTYDQLNSVGIPDFDFLYLSGSATEAQDLSNDVAIQISKKVRNESIPCILSAGNLFEGDLVPNTKKPENIFRLAVMLAQSDLKNAQFDAELVNPNNENEGMVPNINNRTGYGKKFVTDHVFVTDESILTDFTKNITPVPAGLQSVYDTIQLENGFRVDEQKSELPLEVSKATIIRHIMNYMNGRESQVKKNIKVLEIHPAFSMPKMDNMMKWASSVQDITTKVVTPEALNSSFRTLNDQYDLIYIGASTDYMNKDDNTGATAYNDSSLNGLLYHSKGDAPYKGNDIGTRRMKDIEEFVSADYPIIIASQLFSEDGSVNGKFVDKDSNLYKLLNTIKSRKNVFIENELKENDRMLQLYLNQPSISVSASLNGVVVDGSNYHLIEQNNGNYELKYTFTILQDGLKEEDAAYHARLFLDLKDNGTYDKEMEFIITENGNEVTGPLKPNTEYELTRALPLEYSGVFGVKLVINQLKNPYVYTHTTDVVELVDNQVEKVKVLQLGGESKNTLDLEANLSVANTPYNKKAKQIEALYKFEVTHVTMDELKDIIHGNPAKFVEKNPDFLKQFDVVVVGFFNQEVQNADEKVLEALKAYIASKKGIVFTANTRGLMDLVLPADQKSTGPTYAFINRDKKGYLNISDNSQNKILKADPNIGGLNISPINEGMILEYPFPMPATVKIGLNRGQDYQINADTNDLRVWYCLGNSGGNTTMYSLSPNDGSNNYYLYSQNNVYFNGFTGKGDCSEEEVGLFFNTVIAAYNSGIKSPVIKVMETADKQSSELDIIYRLFDENFTGNGTLQDSKGNERIYFTVENKNHAAEELSLTGRFMYHKEKAGSSESTIQYHGAAVPVSFLKAKVYDAVTNQEVGQNNNFYTLTSGGVYYIDIPNTTLSQCEDGLTLYFEANSNFKMGNNELIVPEPSYAKVDVMRIYLFDLK